MHTTHATKKTTGTTTTAAIHVKSSESEDDEWDETVTEKSVNTINNKCEWMKINTINHYNNNKRIPGSKINVPVNDGKMNDIWLESDE